MEIEPYTEDPGFASFGQFYGSVSVIARLGFDSVPVAALHQGAPDHTTCTWLEDWKIHRPGSALPIALLR